MDTSRLRSGAVMTSFVSGVGRQVVFSLSSETNIQHYKYAANYDDLGAGAAMRVRARGFSAQREITYTNTVHVSKITRQTLRHCKRCRQPSAAIRRFSHSEQLHVLLANNGVYFFSTSYTATQPLSGK